METKKLSQEEIALIIEQITEELADDYMDDVFQKFIDHFYPDEDDKEDITSKEQLENQFYRTFVYEAENEEEAADTFANDFEDFTEFELKYMDMKKYANYLFHESDSPYVYVDDVVFTRYID